ncbi:MAG: Gfo/Idh/MocA family oxidoreductase [Bryobacterales bacterium]|nr:Gfo/Idh/MocA family oxidoreductase [Bryobacterales bacterium]
MARIKTAIIGTGFMGAVHAEGIRRLGNVDIACIAGLTDELASGFAKQIGVEKSTSDYKAVLADPSIQAVHVCTPNALHYPISKEAMEAGKAVLCEKPLALDVTQAQDLVDTAAKTGSVNCLNHNLRYYPLPQQIREMIAAGELGDILNVQGTYAQDWLLYDTDYNWRIERKDNGALRAVGDIGSHWMDMIQHVTGLKITALCADLATFHKTRKKPKMAIDAFAGKTFTPDDYDEVPIDTEDYGAVLLHLGDRARGAFTVTQLAAGCKNRFQIEIFGTKRGVIWNQERPNELWIGERNEANRLLLKDPSLLGPKARTYASLPGGHVEGYADTHKNVYRAFYRKVADASVAVEYPTFNDGLLGMKLLEKIIESDKKRCWVDTGL